MRNKHQFAGSIAAVALSVMTANAADSAFIGLGDLSGGAARSVATAVSADGLVVTGYSESASGTEAIRWDAETLIQGLGFLSDGLEPRLSQGAAISADGSTIVGLSTSSEGGVLAFRHTASGMALIGDLPGGPTSSVALGVTSDGSTVVGSGFNATDGRVAFRWDDTGGFTELLGLRDNRGAGDAFAITPDGSRVVGVSDAEATVWDDAGSPHGLGDLPGGARNSEARAVSADGNTIVGRGRSGSGDEAFIWTSAAGMVSIGDFAGGGTDSIARAVSADGTLVAGRGSDRQGDEAFIWDANNGLRRLRAVLINQHGLGAALEGWQLTEVRGMSADGSTLVGAGIGPDGNPQGWIATIPEPSAAALIVWLSTALLHTRRPLTPAR